MSERREPVSTSDQDLLRVLMDHMPDLIYFKDLESRFIRINRALAARYGLKDPAEAVGRTDADYYPKEFARATREMEKEIIKTGEPRIDVEEKLVWPDGRMLWVSATKLPLRDPQGKIVGTFGVSRDISHLKQAQEEIRRSERLYRSLVDNLPQNFFLKDQEGRVLFGNRA
ncbi:MAG TPA: PAS domain S-box protein, partial [Planctomycetota bacterium]|nr:PAS domain S-box protein [Planctomycetota bacterium]